MMDNITLIMSSMLPVPAVKGGAVESILENIAKMQEKYNKVNLTIISSYDINALKYSNAAYKNTRFIYIKVSKFYKFLDKIVLFIAKKFLKKKNLMAYGYIFQRLSYYNKISKTLKENDYGKLVLENSMGLYLSLKWRKNYLKYKEKYYYHCHNDVSKDFGCKDIIKNTKKFISVSRYSSNQLEKFLDIHTQNYYILKNCIDSKRFNTYFADKEKKKIRKMLNINPSDKIIIFVGRLTEEKGIKELIMALKKIKYENYKLIVLGSFFFDTNIENSFKQELTNLMQDLKDKIIFTGFIDYNEVPKYYSIADIAVLPSIWEEPAGLTIIEAMMSGIPVITTDSGGIPEYVDEKSTVIIRRDKDLVENLSIEITNLLNSEKKRKMMSREGLNIASKLTLDSYYFEFLNILK